MKKLTKTWFIFMVVLIVATVALFYIIAEWRGYIIGDWLAIAILVEAIWGILVYRWFVSKSKEAIKEEKKRAIWISSIIAIVTASLIILLIIDKINVGQLIEIIVLLGLVIVTAEYATKTAEIANATKEQAAKIQIQADATSKMAKEMKKQRYDAVRPIIDIEGAFEGVEEAQMKMGSVPDKLTCRLRNIGVGPATDVVSFVQPGTQPDSKYLRTFGALAKGALVKEGEIYEYEIDKWPLSLKQRDNRKFLVAYYRDVYGRCFESSREVTVDKEKGRWELGPLKTPEIAEEEFPK